MKPRTRSIIPILAVLLFASLANVGLADVPRVITFQGKLTDPAGTALAGQFDLTFRLYDVATEGTPIWSETHAAVNVSKGIFAVPLGVITPLDPTFDQQYWVSIQVGADPEMSPRQPLTSAPYALRAAAADNVVNDPIPTGVIVMWSGPIATIPAGWALCDGSNGTPDLRERFVIGASQEPATQFGPDATGGTTTHGHPIASADLPTVTDGIVTQTVDPAEPLLQPDHVHTVTDADHLPPYYALAFIMKQ